MTIGIESRHRIVRHPIGWRHPGAVLLTGLVLVAFAAACAGLGDEASSEASSQASESVAAELQVKQAAALFGPLPEAATTPDNLLSEAKTDLGRMLYYDARLSKNHDISCNSCHQLDRFGVDGEPTSPGHRGQRGDRNSPTVYNAALHVAQFWDGRAPDVEAQAKGPVLNPVEMASASDEAVVAILRSIPGYANAFEKAFPDDPQPISFDNMAKAIGAFERKLMTPGRFDRFVQGDPQALDPEERKGLETFVAVGCASCHMGPALGGSFFRKLGLVHPYETEDPGREKVTGEANDRHVFKVPSLRNVAETGPYFHDGSIGSLGEAVRLMAYHQLGRELDDQQVSEIVVFLESLTGEIDEAYVARPELPASGPKTPAPDPS
jgi:cytochrome c peroxidase